MSEGHAFEEEFAETAGEEQLHTRMAYCDQRSAELLTIADDAYSRGDLEAATQWHRGARHFSAAADVIESELTYGADPADLEYTY